MFLVFFLSLDTALPPREDYVQVDCVLKPRYKKCTEKEKIKMIGLKRRTTKYEPLQEFNNNIRVACLAQMIQILAFTAQICYTPLVG